VRDLVAQSLEEDQAEQVVTIDLAGRTSFADFMVVASGRSTRHVGALAENLAARLKQAGVSVPEMEGMPQCDWVLVDAGDVIVHLFRAETRSFYNLEKLWRFEPDEIPDTAAVATVAAVMTPAAEPAPASAAPQITAGPARRFTVRTAGMTVGVR